MDQFLKRKTAIQSLIISCCILSFVFANAHAQGFAKTNAAGEVTEVNIVSSNENTSFARTGDVVTITFNASSDLATPEVVIAGQPVTATAASYLRYAASLTVTSTDTEGQVAFSILFKNAAGDTANLITATTDNSVVYIDNTRPTTSMLAIISQPVKEAFNISISFSEAIKEFNTSRINVVNATLTNFDRVRNNLIVATVMPLHDGEVSIQIPDSTAFDAAGNPNIASATYTVKAAFNGMFDKIYPNPASTNLTIKYVPVANEKAVISLMSYNGVTVYEKELTMDGVTITIDVSNYPPGMYMLFTKSKNYSFYTNVIIAH